MLLKPENSLLLSELRGLPLSQWFDEFCVADDQSPVPKPFEPGNVIWMTEEKSPEEVLKTVQDKRISHVIQKNALDYISGVATAARMLKIWAI